MTFANPGGTAKNVTLANASTAGLYCYTPYVGPYSTTYGYPGTGYSGSFNFVISWDKWWGSSVARSAYAWSLASQSAYTDSGRTQTFSSDKVIHLNPGQKAYIKVEADNTGTHSWSQSSLHLGTYQPKDRSGTFYDSSSWLWSTRPAQLDEATVAPNDTGTFYFAVKAPSKVGNYTEHYNPVAEHITWLNNGGLALHIDVTNTVPAASTHYQLSSGDTMTTSNPLISQDGKNALFIRNGHLSLTNDYDSVWLKGSGATKSSHARRRKSGTAQLQ